MISTTTVLPLKKVGIRVSGLVMMLWLISACQWVKGGEGADTVALVKPVHVDGCKRLGSTTSTVKSKVGFVHRGQKKVALELLTLAKNEAVKMKADSVLATSEVEDGRQSFDIYRCR